MHVVTSHHSLHNRVKMLLQHVVRYVVDTIRGVATNLLRRGTKQGLGTEVPQRDPGAGAGSCGWWPERPGVSDESASKVCIHGDALYKSTFFTLFTGGDLFEGEVSRS